MLEKHTTAEIPSESQMMGPCPGGCNKGMIPLDDWDMDYGMCKHCAGLHQMDEAQDRIAGKV